jgi:hypothetical protein
VAGRYPLHSLNVSIIYRPFKRGRCQRDFDEAIVVGRRTLMVRRVRYRPTGAPLATRSGSRDGSLSIFVWTSARNAVERLTEWTASYPADKESSAVSAGQRQRRAPDGCVWNSTRPAGACPKCIKATRTSSDALKLYMARLLGANRSGGRRLSVIESGEPVRV